MMNNCRTQLEFEKGDLGYSTNGTDWQGLWNDCQLRIEIT